MTERSTPSTPKASLVMRGSTVCISSSVSFSSTTPRCGGERDDAAGDMVGFAERHLERLHEPVSEIGGGCVAHARRSLHAFGFGGHVLDHAGHRGKAKREGLEGVEHTLLVLLHVFGISERQTFHHREQGR